MPVPVHRAVSAVLQVMLVAFVTLSARVQHGVLRSKHWFAPATAVAAYALVGLTGWLWLVRPNRYIP
jgi:ABC-type nickel/cobalt efflux system permease component RcnA